MTIVLHAFLMLKGPLPKILVLTTSFLLAAGSIAAAGDSGKEDEKETKWYDKLDFGGDFRLRYEGFNWTGHFDDGRRDRFRYRFRLGLEAHVLKSVTLGFQLRSGDPQNPISDNQSLDDSFGKGRISIAEAYADWQAAKTLSLIFGKFAPTDLWTAADFQWDDDVVTEGAMERFEWRPGGALEKVNLNLYQFVLNESGDSVDSYMLGGQIIPVFALGEANDLAVGAGFEAISHPEKVAKLYLEGDLVIDSGYVTNFLDPQSGDTISDFRVGSLVLEWKSQAIKRWPVKLSLFFYKNFGAGDGEGAILPVASEEPALALGRGRDNDTAFFGRIQVGDYKKPGQVAVRFARYDSKPDAIFFAYAQSDTRRASNVDGYRTDVRVGMPSRGYVNVTWYRTRWTVGNDSAMSRWQFDYVFRF